MNITKETIKKLSENWKNPMSGGLSDNSNPSDFDIDQIINGVKIELEHTKDLKIALKISMDHLQEFPKYYDYLIDMENKIKKELKENFSMKQITDYLDSVLNESKESRELMKQQHLTYTGYGVYKDKQGNKFEYDTNLKKMKKLALDTKVKLGEKFIDKYKGKDTKKTAEKPQKKQSGKKISKEELKNILDLHAKWLRDEEGGKRADLHDANLHGANLQRVNLQGANLQYANLHDANLHDANLRSADLIGANLQYANLIGANLAGADLWSADLAGADLRDADLTGANLRYANLWSANLWSANLHDANLTGAKNVNLKDAKR